jgi:hypothetical protein
VIRNPFRRATPAPGPTLASMEIDTELARLMPGRGLFAMVVVGEHRSNQAMAIRRLRKVGDVFDDRQLLEHAIVAIVIDTRTLGSIAEARSVLARTLNMLDAQCCNGAWPPPEIERMLP